MTWPSIEWTTRSPEQTRQLGGEVGRCMHTGMILYLLGDLGSGKTAFVQGLAEGLGVPPEYYITSPTYTLIHEYPGRLPLYHVDLYRLADEDDFEEIGLYDVLESAAVTAVEWSERIPEARRGEGLTVRFRILDDEIRRIRLIASGLAAADLIREVGKFHKERSWA